MMNKCCRHEIALKYYELVTELIFHDLLLDITTLDAEDNIVYTSEDIKQSNRIHEILDEVFKIKEGQLK